ncbi:MAG: hypothetical protein RMJ98_04990 [Myxococcales bacterium]|nr:hypothetical protein [Polyangiaceae bacterium]MDW8248644.1 hypothetical protein [Myxococcales bacterium]
MKNLFKPLLPVTVALGLSSATREAAAGPLDFDRGNFLIATGERMFGFGLTSTTTEISVGNQISRTTQSDTGIGLLVPAGGNAANTPTLGLHYAVIPALTLGASLGLTRTSSKVTTEVGGKSETKEGDPTTGILLAPRVGYIFFFSEAFYLWARGGVSYYQTSTSKEETAGTQTTKTSQSTSATMLSLDPMFVFTPVARFGFMFGPVLDYGVSGKNKVETTVGSTTNTQELDFKTTNFSFQFGLMGYI